MKTMKKYRRLLEMAYLYAWGVEGNSDLRDEWKELFKNLTKQTKGGFLYLGNNKFRWIEKY